MDYLINFASTVSPAQVKDAVLAHWPLTPESVFAGTAAAFDEYEGPQLTVLLQSGLRPRSDFDTELSAGEAFADACGRLNELRLATVLCKALGARALVDDGGRSSLTWMLVTDDGWHGRVVLREDDEDDGMVIDHALQPVPSAPEIAVQAPPAWERGWYDGGVVPDSGYLTAE